MIIFDKQAFATIKRVLNNDLSNAKDNLIRHKMQQKRMPFDHDNNNSLEQCEKWVAATEHAIDYIERLDKIAAIA